jgi:uncharacterized membrane protein YGL010W
MCAKKSASQWFAAYGETHQDSTNELIHWICVPLIFWSVLGFIWSIPVPEPLLDRAPWFNWCLPAILLAHLFYVRLSVPLSVGLLFFMAICYAVLALLDLYLSWPVWRLCAVVFVLAWVGQFIGHRVEGKKPSFLQDLSFLLIGPAWLMSFVYKRLGQPY